MERAIFLDRDGTIIEEVGYLRRADQLRLLPGAAEAIRRLRSAGLKIIMATNQSAIGRGLLSEAEFLRIQEILQGQLEARGAGIDALYYCPHHPEAELATYRRTCECRKPAPGMLLRAARDYGLDLSGSVMVGDKYIDIETGLNASAAAVLVRTGYGADESARRDLWPRPPHHVAGNLEEAADWILMRMAQTPAEGRNPSGTPADPPRETRHA